MANKILTKVQSKLSLGLALAVAVSALNACSSTNAVFDKPLKAPFEVSQDDIVISSPDIAEREQYQLMISQMTSMLSKEGTSPEQRAQLLYQLGLLYDRLGLDVTARTMFMSALIEVPDFARSYNFLGIYLASSERFSEAYDAYDAVLDIDPNEQYAYFNRGIALYYGDRVDLGLQDLEKFYNFDINEPFRVAWLYILERTKFGKDEAIARLTERMAKMTPEKDEWGVEILDLLAEKVSGHELIEQIRTARIDNGEQSRRLCEAYFYMAKLAAFEGKIKRAYDLFHLCMATNITGYLEYRYALLEVTRYERQEAVATADRAAAKYHQKRNAFLQDQAQEAHSYFEQLNKQMQESQEQAQMIKSKEQGSASDEAIELPKVQDTKAQDSKATKSKAKDKKAKDSKAGDAKK